MVSAQWSIRAFSEPLLEPWAVLPPYTRLLFARMPAGGLLSFKPHRENWDSKRWAEEEAGRDSLRPPVCPWPPAFLGQMSGPSLSILLEM